MLDVEKPACYLEKLSCYLYSSVKETVASAKPSIGDGSAEI